MMRSLDHFGLVIDRQVSSTRQVLATDHPNCGLPMAQRVTVLASWNCSRSREAQLAEQLQRIRPGRA